MNVEWKDVPGYEGLYKVSCFGEIYSEYYKRILTPYLSNDGYLRINLCKDKKVKITMLHRIIAETFISNPKGLPVVNHIDGNKANPSINNLEWVSHSGNLLHAYSNGLAKISDKCKKAVSLIAAENGAKTTSKAVCQMDLEGNMIQEFSSMRAAERITGIFRPCIARACISTEYSAGGFKWQKK